MEQTFRLEMKDSLSFHAFILRRSTEFWATCAVIVLVLDTPKLLFLILSRTAPSVFISEFVGQTLANIAITLLIMAGVIIGTITQRVGSLGLFTTAITSEFFIERNPVFEIRVRWELLTITENSQLLVFQITPLIGYIIPKRAFRNAEQAHMFLNTARAYQNGLGSLSTSDDDTAWPPAPQRETQKSHPLMEQPFQLEMKDHLAFNYFLMKRSAALLVTFGILLLAFTLPGLILLLVSRPSPLALLAGLLGIVLFNLGVIAALIRVFIVSTTKRHPGAIGSFTISISPEIVMERSPMIETRIRWEKVVEILETPHFLAFLISPSVGHIVPKRAFRDSEHARAFLETARSYQNGMVSPNAPTSGDWPPAPQRRRIDP